MNDIIRGNWKAGWLDLVLVGVGGLGAFLIGNIFAGTPNPRNTARIIREEGKPAIIRTYEKARWDQILVEMPANSGVYVSLDKYLDNIENKYDRRIKRAEIEKAADW